MYISFLLPPIKKELKEKTSWKGKAKILSPHSEIFSFLFVFCCFFLNPDFLRIIKEKFILKTGSDLWWLAPASAFLLTHIIRENLSIAPNYTKGLYSSLPDPYFAILAEEHTNY